MGSCPAWPGSGHGLAQQEDKGDALGFMRSSRLESISDQTLNSTLQSCGKALLMSSSSPFLRSFKLI